MPYLPLDLDAKRKLEAIERGLGLPRHTMVGGAMDMWETVWRQKSALVDNITLWAAFGPQAEVVLALVSRGFLEPSSDGKYRVCGAEQWLFGMEGKRRGGHAAKANLVPGAKQKKKANQETGQPRDSAEKPDSPTQVLSASAETKPRPPLGSLSALSPNNPTTQQASKNIAGAEAPPESSGGWKELVDALFAAFRNDRKKDPEPGGKDWKALKRLRGRTKQGDGEIVVRWQRGLRAQFKQRVDCFADLDERWDSLASADPPKSAGGSRFVAAQDVDKASFSKVGTLDDF